MSMQSRRDLFQAHRLMTQRAALALLRGEPDVPDQPLRRINVATFSSILVGVIAVAIFGIWGLLFHGAPPLQFAAGTLVIDKQTGTDYTWCGHGNKDLCPMANYTSALLALRSSTPVTVQTVNQSSLTGVPQGPELGVLGLPQDLPGPGLLVKQPWSVCTQTLNDVPKVGQETTTTVSGGIQTGGQQLGGDALLVKTSGQNGQDWVIWDNERLSISTSTLLAEFGQQPVSVPTVWLNAIPQGPGFRESLPQGPKTFVNGPAGQQVEVGQLYTVNNAGSTQYYEVLQDGRLRPLTPLEASLLSIAGAPAQQSLAASDLNNGHVEGTLSTDGLPTTRPQVSGATPPASFCAVYSGSGSTPQVQTGGQMPSQGTPTGAPVNSGQIDSVALPDGKAALVQETGDNISYFLVTGGRRYPMASEAVPIYLGYSLSDAVRVPASVMDLIPSGPVFNPSQANDLVPPQPVGTGSSG